MMNTRIWQRLCGCVVHSFYPLSSCPRVPGEPASEVNSVLLMWAVVAALILGHFQDLHGLYRRSSRSSIMLLKSLCLR